MINTIISKHLKASTNQEWRLLAAAAILFTDKKTCYQNLAQNGWELVVNMSIDTENTMKQELFLITLAWKYWHYTNTHPAQLTIFLQGIDTNFNITADLLCLLSMENTTKDSDIY